MKIQESLALGRVTDENLSFLKAIGVDCVAVNGSPDLRDGRDRADCWKNIQKRAQSHGLEIHTVGNNAWDEITLGLEDRDEKIQAWCTLLRNLGEAGIRALGYDFKPGGVYRTTPTPGRGGSQYSTFDCETFVQDLPRQSEKAISEAQLWDNLIHFLERVIPVAEEAGVRMALHPDDPPIPEPFAGVAQVVSTLEQYRRVFDAVPSDFNGMLLCQGSVSEMGVDACDAIREMGPRGKIVYVHFRSIRGTPRNFQEVFVDEGDVDMVRAMEAYRDAGFKGPFMMDHTPRIPGDGQAMICSKRDYYPDGTEFVGVGVRPDIEVRITAEAFQNGEDEPLSTALHDQIRRT